MSQPYTRQEMMAVATGREISDGEQAIFGVGLSMLAGFFAQTHHAPNVRALAPPSRAEAAAAHRSGGITQ